MAHINRVELLGHVGADPEVKTLQEGGKLVTLRLATTERWKDKQSGEKKSRTEWHSVVVFDEGKISFISTYLKKGTEVLVVGALRTRKWQDQSGNDRYSTDIVLQGPRSDIQIISSPEGRSGSGGNGQQSGGEQNAAPANDYDYGDDIPL